jgi:4-hydroxyphenylpyruvate dioxygenase
MTYYEKQAERPAVGTFYGFHHLRFYVSNAKQAASFYTTRFGFTPVAYEGLETGSTEQCTQVVRQNNLILAFTASLQPTDTAIGQHVLKHGDGVRDVAFLVDDARGIYEKAVSRGAKGVREPTEISDEHGSMVVASVQTYGDTVHTMVQNVNYTGIFMPGYAPTNMKEPINELFPPTGLLHVDHVVGNQPDNEMTPTAEWYERYLDFHRYWSVDEDKIYTEYSALRSIVVADWDEVVKMPINEPAPGLKKSQIQEYCEFYGGPGVQHIAALTNDIVHSVSQLTARGVEFLIVPHKYYENLRKRLVGCPTQIQEDLDTLERLHILVDFDDNGYLLQIFTKPVEDRPTLFWEIIQRRNHNGFGIGNFKALFEALELEQAKRGTL